MDERQLHYGVIAMKFEDVYGRFQAKQLTTKEASLMLGITQRTFLRYRDRYEETPDVQAFDRRKGRRSGRCAADEEVERITRLYEERYRGFTVQHFHEYATRQHGLRYGYTWTKKRLAEAKLVIPTKRGGPHRQRRPRSPMEGMMLHQDGSTHRWITALDYDVDLIITMDDATSTVTSGFFVPQEGTHSSLQGVKETIEAYGLFCSFYTDRGSHYAYTPDAGGKVDKHALTQVGKALKLLGIQHIMAYSPQARGRSERMFGTLQKRIPQELAVEGITTIEAANKYLKEVFIPRHNARFRVEPHVPQKAYTPWTRGDLNEYLCIREERVVQNQHLPLSKLPDL